MTHIQMLNLKRTDYEPKSYQHWISLTNDYLQMIIYNVRRLNAKTNMSLFIFNE